MSRSAVHCRECGEIIGFGGIEVEWCGNCRPLVVKVKNFLRWSAVWPYYEFKFRYSEWRFNRRFRK